MITIATIRNTPLEILNDAQANPYVDGSAFHLYAGDISALGNVHNAYPEKNVLLHRAVGRWSK